MKSATRRITLTYEIKGQSDGSYTLAQIADIASDRLRDSVHETCPHGETRNGAGFFYEARLTDVTEDAS